MANRVLGACAQYSGDIRTDPRLVDNGVDHPRCETWLLSPILLTNLRYDTVLYSVQYLSIFLEQF